MRIVLVNLDRSPDRLDFMDRELTALGLSYERLAAVDGGLLDEEERRAFVADRPRDGRSGWLPGQIGCFLSHAKAWRHIAASDEAFGVILEDDVHLSEQLFTFLESSAWIPGDADIVRLETTGHWLKLQAPVSQFHRRNVMRVRSSAWGTGGYIIRRETARRLLAVPPARHEPVDQFLFRLGPSGVAEELVTYQVVPALCVQSKFDLREHDVLFDSLIEDRPTNRIMDRIVSLRRHVSSYLLGKTRVDFEDRR